jgi:adenylate cyclase
MAKILVVDDNEDMRNLAVEILCKNYEVFTADSWANINQYIFHQNMDLILLDVNMPILTGSDIVGLLKKTAKGKAIKIVLFSAMDELALRQEARRVGADGYIAKTYDGPTLTAKVRKFLT